LLLLLLLLLQGLGHVELTVKDLQRALKLKPGDQEVGNRPLAA
jgi:hypothetical protein